jgi:hypothetical protein
VEAGVELWAGVVPAVGALPTVEAAVEAVWSHWRGLGLEPAAAGGVLLTPTCGLAGAASPSEARSRLARLRQAAAALAERSAE